MTTLPYIHTDISFISLVAKLHSTLHFLKDGKTRNSTHSKSEENTGIENTITTIGKYNKDLRTSQDLMRDDNHF